MINLKLANWIYGTTMAVIAFVFVSMVLGLVTGAAP